MEMHGGGQKTQKRKGNKLRRLWLLFKAQLSALGALQSQCDRLTKMRDSWLDNAGQGGLRGKLESTLLNLMHSV